MNWTETDWSKCSTIQNECKRFGVKFYCIKYAGVKKSCFYFILSKHIIIWYILVFLHVPWITQHFKPWLIFLIALPFLVLQLADGTLQIRLPYQSCFYCLGTNGVTACVFIPFDPFTIGTRCSNKDLLFFPSFFLISVALALMGADDRRWTTWANFLNAKHLAAIRRSGNLTAPAREMQFFHFIS